MAIAATELRTAADRLIETSLLGADWTEPLDGFAKAAGAVGATLVRETPTAHRASAPRSVCLLSTPDIAPAVSQYLDGRTPPDPRLARVNPTLAQGFISDFNCFSREEISNDPFYQEFLRPEGLQWHCCVRLIGSGDAPRVYLSLKRAADRKPYAPGEVRVLNQALAQLRAAAASAQGVFQALGRERARLLSGENCAVIELAANGRIVDANAAAAPLLPGGLVSRSGRLIAPQQADQPTLEAALARALGPIRQPGCVVLSGQSDGARLVLRLLPVTGAARDVFCDVSVIVHVNILTPPQAVPDSVVNLLRDALRVTPAEARVCALIGQGVPPRKAARMLGVSEGTLRNYLKSAMGKTGIDRQAGLAAVTTSILAWR